VGEVDCILSENSRDGPKGLKFIQESGKTLYGVPGEFSWIQNLKLMALEVVWWYLKKCYCNQKTRYT
jgi:hypothetical protein